MKMKNKDLFILYALIRNMVFAVLFHFNPLVLTEMRMVYSQVSYPKISYLRNATMGRPLKPRPMIKLPYQQIT
jgi:hypothetical protein